MLEATSKGISAVLTPFGMAGTRPTTAEKKLDTQKHPNYDNYHVDEDGDVYLSGSEDLHDLKDVKAPDMTEEEAKKASSDATLVAVLHHLRKRFVEQGLVGEVQVGSTFGGIQNSVKCSITKDSIVDHNLIIPEKAPSVIMNLIVSCISKLLLALEQRAKGYKNKPYAKDVLLTSGMTVGASFAFVSLFSISLSCGATVDSLTHYNEAKLQGRLDEKKRKEDEKAMKKKEQKDKH